MSSGGPSLTSKIKNFRLMPSLIAATIATEKPTDGYLISDIIKMSHESTQTRIFLQEYLMNQLVCSKNVYVKSKVLNLFIELVRNGHPEMRQNLTKQEVPINDAAKLRCSDPNLAGDVGRIRDQAKKLLDMLYDESCTTTPPTASVSSHPPSRSQPFSSTEGSSNKYVGFGNTNSSLSSSETTATSTSIANTLSGMFSRKPQHQTKVPTYDQDYASMDPVHQNTQQNNVIRVVPQSAPSYTQGPIQPGAEHTQGRAGGGWDDANDVAPSQPVSTSVELSSQHSSSLHRDPSAVGQDSTEQEQRLVDAITTPGGVRAAPARDQLDQFIAKCKVMDALVIMELLREKLTTDSNQIVLKTLFVLEAMMRSDIPDVESYLDVTLQELSNLSQSPHAGTRSKATKLLKQLGAVSVDAPSQVEKKSPRQHRHATNATGTIVDVGSGGDGSLIDTNDTDTSKSSMFDGLSVTEQQAVPVSNESASLDSMFGNLHIQPSVVPAPQQTRGAEGEGLIDFGDADEPFDPLMRTSSSASQISRTGSLLRSGSASSQSAFSFLQQQQKSSLLPASREGELLMPAPSSQPSPQQQPFMSGSVASSLQQQYMPVSVMDRSSNPPGLMLATGVPQVQQQQQPSPYHQQQQMYHSVPGTMQQYPTNQQQVQMPLLGNSARPVQLASQTSTEESGSFSFLGKKSSKTDTFDFVQDAMKASSRGTGNKT